MIPSSYLHICRSSAPDYPFIGAQNIAYAESPIKFKFGSY